MAYKLISKLIGGFWKSGFRKNSKILSRDYAETIMAIDQMISYHVTARNTTQQVLLSKNHGYLMEVTAIRVTVIRVTADQNVTHKRSLESAPSF